MKIQNVADREKLAVRPDPYWVKVAKGCYLGFRKTSSTLPGTWLARCQIDTDKREFKTFGDYALVTGSERYRLALKDASTWFAHLAKGGQVEGITVLQACQRYTETLDNPASGEYSKRYANCIAPYKLANISLDKLTPRDVAAWRKAHTAAPCITGPRKGQPRSASTLNRDMAAVRAALNQAKHDGFTTTDFAWQRELGAVPGATGRRDTYLGRVEIDAFMTCLDADAKPFFKALCLIPLRPGAMAQATVGDFNKALGVLSVTKDKTKKIQIALPPVTREFFAAQCLNKLPGALLFARGDGVAWTKDTWPAPFNRAAKLASLPAQACTYSLRHAGITNMIQAGIDVLTVAQISNTSVRMIEATYGHLTASHSVNALQVLAG